MALASLEFPSILNSWEYQKRISRRPILMTDRHLNREFGQMMLTICEHGWGDRLL
jgi:hypothetical protein